GERARHPRRRSARGGGAPRARRRRGAARRLHLLLVHRPGVLVQRWRLVLRQAALQRAPRKDADEPAVLGYRNTLEILVLQEAEGLVERQLRVERVSRRLGDLAYRRLRRVTTRRDDVAN